ncbi:putative Holliday junction resolvase [Enhygromyxa salina]|uniref:Putative pre-16S rRNA nuclease n=1 Tax=Enhygromyxa salina TaxID=215803 RepID=A0A2S9YGF1_9BACT|nr:Holliday junction resolvase RuvX [Enhygromyxa salina]PRQ04122.1 putative Holliday junction resolvase [Enhygromyxa salina]
MRALALDVGSKTIGIAVSDAGGSMAHAREVLRRAGTKADAPAICARARELEAELIVVGLPLELDGSEGHRARLVRRFITALEAALEAAGAELGVVTWDERFSTSAAERTLLEADLSRAKRKRTIDAVAAQFILQGWLDAQPENRPEAGEGRAP